MFARIASAIRSDVAWEVWAVSVILVSGGALNRGATTIAVGLAHRLAYAGHRVRIERLSGDERAAQDAETFSLLEFATSSGAPVDAASVTVTLN